jgi:hypothetical protein
MDALCETTHEEKRAEGEAGPENSLAKVLETFFEGGRAVSGGSDERTELAELCVSGCRDHHGASFAPNDRGADEQHVDAVANGSVAGDCSLGVFADRSGLAGECGFFGSKLYSLEDTSVGRDRVASFELEDIAYHEVRGGDHKDLVVAADTRVGCLHFLERIEGGFGADLLVVTKGCVEGDDEEDGGSVAKAREDTARTSHPVDDGDDCGAEEGEHDGVGELREELTEAVWPLGLWECVGAVAFEALDGVGVGEASGGVGAEALEERMRGFGVDRS